MNNLVVITGATHGIGKALVEYFASNAYDIVTCSRQEEELKNLQKNIKKQFGQTLYYKVSDLSKKKEVMVFANFVKNIEKPVDVLINNAGIFLPSELSNNKDDNLEILINTNLYSAYYLTRALLPLIRTKKGIIFNICSVASLIAYKGGAAYAISKHALLGFSKSLREELKLQGIRVTSVLPGATYTRSWAESALPEERFIPVEDIAKTIYTISTLSPRTVVEDIVLRPQKGDI